MKTQSHLRSLGLLLLLIALSPAYPANEASAQDNDAGKNVPTSGLPIPRALLAEEQVGPEQKELLPLRDAGLQQLVTLAKQVAPATLGFEKPPALGELAVLTPFPEALIVLEDLKRYEAGTNPAAVLKNRNRLTFPVLKDDRVVSSVTLSNTSGAWRPVSFGSVSIIRLVMEARIKAPVEARRVRLPMLPGKGANYRIVTVTGLEHRFLAAESTSGLLLVPLFDEPRLRFRAGVPRPAGAVLLALKPDALAFQGLRR